MRSRPLVSLIVPTFNRMGLLEDTLDSLINQTFKDFELIVIDDFSTDHTQNYLASLSHKFPLSYIRNPSNLGESRSVNIGWARAIGDLVAVVNSDDPQPKNWLEKMISEIRRNPGFLIYYPNVIIRDTLGNEIEKRYLDNWRYKAVVRKLQVTSSAGAILNKKLLPLEFKPRIDECYYPSDLFQSLQIATLGEGLKIESVFANWTRHSGNDSSTVTFDLMLSNFYQSLLAWQKLTGLNRYSKYIQISYFWGQLIRFAYRNRVMHRFFEFGCLRLFLLNMCNPVKAFGLLIGTMGWLFKKIFERSKSAN